MLTAGVAAYRALQYVEYGAWGYRTSYPIGSVVDVPDEKYLRGFTNSLTVTPFYTWGLSQRYPSGGQAQAWQQKLKALHLHEHMHLPIMSLQGFARSPWPV